MDWDFGVELNASIDTNLKKMGSSMFSITVMSVSTGW